MTKYYDKQQENYENRDEFEVEEVKKTTVIKTDLGEATITPGNYIATNKDGSKFGIPAADLNALYAPVSTK